MLPAGESVSGYATAWKPCCSLQVIEYETPNFASPTMGKHGPDLLQAGPLFRKNVGPTYFNISGLLPCCQKMKKIVLLWGPLFVGTLFGRTCWTCLNPPLQVGKHTIQTSKHCRAPKSKIESRAHYAPQSARGSRQDMCRNWGQRSVSSKVETNERTDGHDRLKYLSAIAVEC